MSIPSLSVSVVPATIPGGGTADIKITTDPDSEVVTLDVTVTDSKGVKATKQATLTISNAHTFAVVPSIGTVTQDAADKSLFHYQAP